MKRTALIFCLGLNIWSARAQVSLEWTKTLGGNYIDAPEQILQLSDGGYLVVGYTESTDDDVTLNHGKRDAWIVRLNAAREIQWAKTYGGTASDGGTDVVESDDGGFFVAGYSNSNDGDVSGRHGTSYDGWIFKISGNGQLLWQRMYGGSANDWPAEIIKTSDGGCLVVGFTLSGNGDITGNLGSWDGFVVKFSTSGAVLWRKTYGGAGSDNLRAVELTDDGGIMLFGDSNSPFPGYHGELEYWLLKTDAQGNLLWQRVFGGSQWEAAQCMAKTAEGNFVLSGRSVSHDGDVQSANPNQFGTEIWTVQVSPTGELLWERAFGGSSNEELNALHVDDFGYLIHAGSTASADFAPASYHGLSDALLAKMSPSGELVWVKTIGGYDFDICHAFALTPDGGFVLANSTFSVTGEVVGNHGDYDIWLTKLGATVGAVEPATFVEPLRISPNPANDRILLALPEDFTPIQIVIKDANGTNVLTARKTVEINIAHLPAGMYTATAQNRNGESITGKFIKIQDK